LRMKDEKERLPISPEDNCAEPTAKAAKLGHGASPSSPAMQ
jgi:hypothetical protein